MVTALPAMKTARMMKMSKTVKTCVQCNETIIDNFKQKCPICREDICIMCFAQIVDCSKEIIEDEA